MTAPARSPIDAAIFDSLERVTITRAPGGDSFDGTMRFPASLVGPPGRVHGGVHPIARTWPILARLRGEDALPSRVRIDAALQKALPLDASVPFTGSYVVDERGYTLTTRFFDGDRLLATARDPEPGDLPSGAQLDRFRALVERCRAEDGALISVIGVRYRLSPSGIVFSPSEPGVVDVDSHFARCRTPDGTIGLAALATQLDAIGAASQGVRMRHPHFTKHLSLSFDTRDLAADTRLVVIGDRTTIRSDDTSDTPRVEIRGVSYGTSITEVIAVDDAFERCFGHGYVWAHPIDPGRFAAFEDMRKLRE